MAETLLVAGGGGKAGAVLTVTAPVGADVTVSKNGKTYRKTSDGAAVFRGLASGWWTVEIMNGNGHSVTRQVEITADYSLTMAFFSAFIQVTYPAGSVCMCTKGSNVLTAVGTSGSYTFTVSEAGDWVVSCTDGTDTDSRTVTITADGQTVSADLAYQLYAADFNWDAFGVLGVDYEIVYDDDTPVPQELWTSEKNWKARLLKSNLDGLTPAKDGVIDVFAVGGGGGSTASLRVSPGGAGGGYTHTGKNVSVTAGTNYPVTIGSGAAASEGLQGGSTSAFGVAAAGGYSTSSNNEGATGGSSGGWSASGKNNGSSDGNSNDPVNDTKYKNGTAGYGQRDLPGPNGETGSTREFGEDTGKLYAGGGAGSGGAAGDGGGGEINMPGEDNTGGGAGGANTKGVSNSGGSGIVVIRNARGGAA